MAVIGLGYVGLPTAIGFHEAGYSVWGVDISTRTVEMVNQGLNPTGDPDLDRLIPPPGTERWEITTSTADAVPNCEIVLVTVLTPVDEELKPDLSYVASAGRAVFEAIPKGAGTIVVLESTVYPGVTRETWFPIAEEAGLEIGVDVHIAYCPERFNPGDPAGVVCDRSHRAIGTPDPDIGERLVGFYSKLTTEDVRYGGDDRSGRGLQGGRERATRREHRTRERIGEDLPPTRGGRGGCARCRRNEMELPSVYARCRRRGPLHPRRSVLSDAEGGEGRRSHGSHLRGTSCEPIHARSRGEGPP